MAAASTPRRIWARTWSARRSAHSEDIPRNPATIADNVGDNVGDVAGLGSDPSESFRLNRRGDNPRGSPLPDLAAVGTGMSDLLLNHAALPRALRGGGPHLLYDRHLVAACERREEPA
ncbi:MAG: sodium/proton-translocating pyrophosphatase [Eubacteriales bacterium]